MSEAEAIEKIRQLPSEVQQHLFLFIEFLYKTYVQEGKEVDTFLARQ